MRFFILPSYFLYSHSPPYVRVLRRQEGLIMTALSGGVELSRNELAEILWPHPDDMPEQWFGSLTGSITNLRGKLLPFGWFIVNRYSFGWRLVGPGPEPVLQQLKHN